MCVYVCVCKAWMSTLLVMVEVYIFWAQCGPSNAILLCYSMTFYSIWGSVGYVIVLLLCWPCSAICSINSICTQCYIEKCLLKQFFLKLYFCK